MSDTLLVLRDFAMREAHTPRQTAPEGVLSARQSCRSVSFSLAAARQVPQDMLNNATRILYALRKTCVWIET